MSLHDDLKPELKAPWRTCGVKWALEQAGDQEKVLIGALEDKAVTGDQIAHAITKNLGLPISGEAVRRHRRGVCRCGA